MNPRLQKLRKFLPQENLDAIFVSSLPNIIYLTDFSDFTTFERDGFLLITQKNQYIFTHGIYKEAVEKQVKNFLLIAIKRENPISKSVSDIMEKENIKSLGFEAFDLKVSEYERLLAEVDKKILKPTTLIYKLRAQKTTDEIKALKKACALGDKAFAYILDKLTVGVTEKELALEFEYFIKSHGATLSFDTIVAFGPHASKPHHVPTDTKLKTNQFVLIDCGVKLNNYCSDMTRTVFFGKATEKQKKDYEAVLESQSLAINFIKNNLRTNEQINGKDADAITREYLIKNEHTSMPHSLGHGIGLEVHESPRLTPFSEELLETGNVFSIEPGVYFPDKFGIRIEDIFAIEDNKLITLTKSPRHFIEII
jgi:Xaa-Pro aminopeptidase